MRIRQRTLDQSAVVQADTNTVDATRRATVARDYLHRRCPDSRQQRGILEFAILHGYIVMRCPRLFATIISGLGCRLVVGQL